MSMREDPFTGRITYLGTGIGTLDGAKRDLRRRFGQRPLEPIQVRPGAYFYVTVRAGKRTGFLLGPYVSHMTALANVRKARRIAHEKAPDQAAFAPFGTASVPRKHRPKTVFGR